jgi:hypothetical protein
MMFYKNMIWTVVLFWFQIYCGWTAQILYDYFFITFFNLVFTSLPPMVIGFMDQDISDTMSLAFPPVYKVGIRREFYGLGRFLFYMLDGIYQSVVCFFISFFVFYDSAASSAGYAVGLIQMGTLAATIAVINANIYMALRMLHWTWISHFVVWGSIVVYFLFVIIYANLSDSSLAGIVQDLYGLPAFWLAVPLSIVACLLPRYLLDFNMRLFFPRDTDLLREAVKYKSPEWPLIKKDADDDVMNELPDFEKRHAAQAAGETEQAVEMRPVGPTKSKIRPSEIAQRINAKLDRYISDPLKKNFRKAQSILHLRTGAYSANTGFAFSQEPGVAQHMKELSSPTAGTMRRNKNIQSSSKLKLDVPKTTWTEPPEGSSSRSAGPDQTLGPHSITSSVEKETKPDPSDDKDVTGRK